MATVDEARARRALEVARLAFECLELSDGEGFTLDFTEDSLDAERARDRIPGTRVTSV